MKFKRTFILILSVCLLSVTGAGVQSPGIDDDDIARIRAYVEAEMRVDKIGGITIGFILNDVTWVEGFGFSDLENNTPASPESAYRLASITKPMTAAAVLKLAEQGRLDLDAEIQRYVPYFPRKKWPVTVRHLLGHLAGISHYRDYDVEGHIKIHKDTREALGLFQDFDLVTEPGTAYNYSSYGYNLLGAVVEGASGMSYGAYMRENIWNPLGMNRTHMDSPLEILPGRVEGYQLVKGEIKNSEYVDMSSRFAGGGTRSTVGDLLKFAYGMMEHKLHSEETVDRMFTSMTTLAGRLTGYGMGWSVRPFNGRFSVNHTGSQAETKTALVLFPGKKFAVAVGCNFEQANPRKYAQRVVEILFDERILSVYTGDVISDVLIFAMEETFHYGASFFDRLGKDLAADEADRDNAFAVFRRTVSREALQNDFDQDFRQIWMGRHPVLNRAFVKVGSFMAQKLAEQGSLDIYHKLGAVRFFADYIKLYRSDGDFPEELAFPAEFEGQVLDWAPGWDKAYGRAAAIFPAPYAAWDDMEKPIRRLPKDSPVYPDLSGDLTEMVKYFTLTGKQDAAVKAAKLAIETYPASARPYFARACCALFFGDSKEAMRYFTKADQAAVDKNAANPSGFIAWVSALWDYAGLPDKAKLFIETGLQLFPQSEELHYTLGYLFWEEAKVHLERALDLDPNFSRAWDLLQKIER
jgi:CubicO group peptidase (beta-lactamase class C family)/tetratricopeptide (TPR) repeat protein